MSTEDTVDQGRLIGSGGLTPFLKVTAPGLTMVNAPMLIADVLQDWFSRSGI